MKKYSVIGAVLVFTAFLLAGCRNPNGNIAPSTMPSTMPSTQATTMPATQETTMPVTTMPSAATEQNPSHGAPTPSEGTSESSGATNPGDMGRARSPRVR